MTLKIPQEKIKLIEALVSKGLVNIKQKPRTRDSYKHLYFEIEEENLTDNLMKYIEKEEAENKVT